MEAKGLLLPVIFFEALWQLMKVLKRNPSKQSPNQLLEATATTHQILLTANQFCVECPWVAVKNTTRYPEQQELMCLNV